MGDVRNPAATVRSAIPNRFHSKLWVRTIKLDGDESVLRDQVYQPEAAEDDDLVLNDEQPMRVAYSAIGKRHIRNELHIPLNILKNRRRRSRPCDLTLPRGRAREYPVAFANASGGGVYRTLGEAGS